MTAYYNEIDPYAAQWLRNLIAAGHIAPGVVDERSIEDVRPDELAGYTQCHFFAGVGVWSLALRRAGWRDDQRIWTGSCPCQPFSAAGKGDGFADERHLWPAWFHLITQCNPPVVVGEQVASGDANAWIDLVQTDMEAMGYAFGAVPFPSAGVGAPHIRDRLYWIASAGVTLGDTSGEGLERYRRDGDHQHRSGWIGAHATGPTPAAGSIGRLANYNGSAGRQGGEDIRGRIDRGDAQPRTGLGGGELSSRLADLHSDGCCARGEGSTTLGHGETFGTDCGASRTGPINGLWRAADWLLCRDGKWRPVEPGTFPLAHGAHARVGRLRAYGNAINAKAAEVFIRSFLDATHE